MSLRTQIFYICFIALLGTTAWASTRDYLKRPDRWFGDEEAGQVADNILSWQSGSGGWPKNVDVAAKPYEGDEDDLRGTFDNNATTDELRFLARIFDETHDREYRRAFEQGFDFIIDAQYASGGWPQRYPPGVEYHRHITFNDGAMVRVLELLKEIIENENNYYDFLDRRQEKAVREAFEKGIECILKCQIEVDGKLTAWCAQHDENSYKPRPARAFEMVSLSGCESVGIVRLLMNLEDPDDRVIKAVDAAVAWFEDVQLDGIRVEMRDGDKVVVEDSGAPPLWARFYEMGTNRPFFCGRDGEKKYTLSAIDFERRNGYAWYGNWPQRLLEKEYPAWKDGVD